MVAMSHCMLHTPHLRPAPGAQRPALSRAAYGGNRQSGDRGGLILPGGGGKTAAEIAAERSARLDLPGRPATPPQQPGGQTAEASVTGTIRSFRPPAGFLDAALRGEDVSANFQEKEDVETMLNRLKSQAGAWHDLAKLLPALARSGMNSAAVEEATGLERAYQNVWIVSASVYDSLKQSTEVPDEVVDYFGLEGGEYLLYELRFLSVQQRTAPAVYIAENQLDQRESLVLARAVKEQQRRQGEKMGFSTAPGDCLAFKYYRDALECKKEEDRERKRCIERGLKVVVTDAARAMLEKVVSPGEEQPAAVDGAAPVVKAQLEMVRFTQEELGVRPVAVAGALGSATLSDVSDAPTASLRGAFGTFTTAAASPTEWVALPAWNIILMAKSPVAVYIPDCSKVPAIAEATSATTEAAKAKLVGPALLVCERGTEVAPQKYLLVSDTAGGNLQLAPAEALPADFVIAGSVLFCCRPPSLNFGASAQTSELLQL